jgi:23S rRNA pseudouridine1911/1915/1917 synthase
VAGQEARSRVFGIATQMVEGARYEWVVSSLEAGERLDVVLARKPELGSRSQAVELITRGAVLVDGQARAKRYVVGEGQVIEAHVDVQEPSALVPEEVDVPIPFEDQWLLIADKPAGMPVHPSAGHSSGTLVHALLGHGLAGGESFRPGVVHRLDKDTSGLLVVAKTVEVHRRLVAMMRERTISRRYIALVHGNIVTDSGTIDAPVGRDAVRRKTMAIGGSGAREARTHFRVLERFSDFTMLEVRLDTGRTHQIRVHFLGIGHPVAGDATYGRRDSLGVGRQFLHSARLQLAHPMTGQSLDIQSPLPAELAGVLARLRGQAQAVGRK